MNDLPHSQIGLSKTIPTSLNLQQYQAIEFLLTGKSDIEVAQLVGVESDTVWQWRNQNPEFIIATSALRAAVWAGGVERLRSLRDQALTVVEKAVDRGDEIAAIALLQALGRQRD